MIVRTKWAEHPPPSRVAPQKQASLLSQQSMLGQKRFSFVPDLILKGELPMTENKIPYKIYLDENEIPLNWYNVRADMKNKPAPPV